jgi:basic amino acid/polyamine antiporter, APA family
MSQIADKQPALKRDVGLSLFVLYGVGNIIGAGIYVLVGKVAGEAGFLAPFAFMLAALIAGLSGLSYGELGARYPVSAGESVFVHRAFNRRSLSIAVGLLIALAGLVSAATMARGFVGYLTVFFTAPAWLVELVMLTALTLIALRGIAQSARVAAVLTLIEVGGLLWVIAVASPNLVNLNMLSLADTIPLTGLAWHGVFGGAFLAFFAFIGFEDMVNIAEEVKQPQRTIPRGIVIAFVVSTVLYVLVTLVSITTISPTLLAASDAPLADVYRLATGRPAVIIGVIGLVAVINGALIQIIMASRIFYGMSCNGWLPTFLGTVHPRTHTPVRATLVAGALTIVLVLALPLLSLAKITSAMVLSVFVIINLSLLRIKRLEPAPAGVRSLPMAVPLIGALASVFILLASI